MSAHPLAFINFPENNAPGRASFSTIAPGRHLSARIVRMPEHWLGHVRIVDSRERQQRER